jgi:tetratricopeptide (TPR) repeat protein
MMANVGSIAAQGSVAAEFCHENKPATVPALKPKNASAKPAQASMPSSVQVSALLRPSRWQFRLAALALPFALLAVLELALRLFGYGHPVGFFLKDQVGGRPVFTENQEFARRYFPPGLARSPEPTVVPAVKAPDSCRIFIFGESAAMGDPEPAFAFARILDVLLGARYPGRQFEIINVAVTAINSHVIRQIARDCAPLHGDVWVIYMGNNEVVGPFGAGTVFGAQTPPLAAIRAQIALKGTRTGQLLDALRWRLTRRADAPATWEGMEMFLQQQIRQDDPRMARVYEHFRKNLEDILRLGASSGARLLVSTVVGNLKDCPPFASLHRPDLSPAQLAEWDKLYQAGMAHEAATNPAAALASYQQAAHIDDHFAELHFRAGRCQWALGDFAGARQRFEQAQDLDTLRFRSDTRINQIIREVVATSAPRGTEFVDARAVFATNSLHGVTGGELLWEHVHLNFAGNYLLARAVAEQIADLLPVSVTGNGSASRAAGASTNQPPLLTAAECARRLGLTDWDRYQGIDEMFKRLQNPPFTHQLGHEARLARLQAERAGLRSATHQPAFAAAGEIYRQALAVRPDDWVLHERFAKLFEHFGELGEAEKHWRRVTELLPHYAQGWFCLANVFDAQGRHADAIEVFRETLRRHPDLCEAQHGLGSALAAQGKVEEAIEEFERAIRLKPGFAEARVNLGLLLSQQGRTNEATAQYREALRANTNSSAAHINLGKLLAGQGRTAEAVVHYREAVRSNPDSAVAHYNLGNALAALGRGEAESHYAEAVRINPAFLEARLKLGIELARQGRAAEALAQFQEAVRLQPESAEARLNLGVALAKARRFDEAIEQFRETLRLSPAHPMAQTYLEQAQAARGR